MRRVLRLVVRVLGALVLLGLLVAALGLTSAHLDIRGLDPPLPDLGTLTPEVEPDELPVRVSLINTASQRMPRSLVLDSALDPDPDAPYVMGHPSFVVEWSDGRVLLIEAGMEGPAALVFGEPMEWVGADPIEPRASLAEVAGAALAGRSVGVVFSHLHTDHVGGIGALCDALPADQRISHFATSLQTERGNFTTLPGKEQLADASCLDAVALDRSPAASVPGFPGVRVIRAAGHTPGSQVVVVWVRQGDSVVPYVFSGDVVNAAPGALHDVPKPQLYGLFVVPESPLRQTRMREFLRTAVEEHGMRLVVSHDEASWAAAGVADFEPAEAPRSAK